MAEVTSDPNNAPKKKHSRPRQKKRSTRIDMTAMVDVAFLLLTFFILTTTLAQPRALPAVKPPPQTIIDMTPVKQSKVLTLILGADDQVHYFAGMGDDAVLTTDYSAEGLRQVVQTHLNKHPNRCRQGMNTATCWDPIIVIKPHETSRYANMVDALDEMRILDVPKYALDEVRGMDSLLLAEHGLE